MSANWKATTSKNRPPLVSASSRGNYFLQGCGPKTLQTTSKNASNECFKALQVINYCKSCAHTRKHIEHDWSLCIIKLQHSCKIYTHRCLQTEKQKQFETNNTSLLNNKCFKISVANASNECFKQKTTQNCFK